MLHRSPLLLLLAGAALATLAAAGPALAEMPAGEWIVERIEKTRLPDTVRITMTIAADGTVNGSGGCNRYSGTAKFRTIASGMAFGPIAATKMACPPEIMEHEQRFFEALGKVTSWGKLTIGDEAPRLTLRGETHSLVLLAAESADGPE